MWELTRETYPSSLFDLTRAEIVRFDDGEGAGVWIQEFDMAGVMSQLTNTN